MTNYNIQMKKRKNTNDGWDNIYPITYDTNVFSDNGQTVSEQMTGKALKNKLYKKSIFKELPILFSDYQNIVTQEGVDYIYPQSFTIDWDNKEIFVLYSPDGVQGSNKRWVVVFDLETENYKVCYSAGNAGGEGIVVRTVGANRYLYVKTTGTILGRFNITNTPVNLSTLVAESTYDVGLYYEFSYRKGVWLVEQGGTTIGNYVRRTRFTFFKDLDGAPVISEVVNGVITRGIGEISIGIETTGAWQNAMYADYITKRQGIALGDGFLVQSMGGIYNEGAVPIPYNCHGIKILDLKGQTLETGIIDPKKMLETLETNGYSCNRIESEGIHISPSGEVYSLICHQSRVMPEANNGGIIIFNEMANNNAFDFSSIAVANREIDTSLYETGIFPRSGDGKLHDPLTGSTIDTLDKLLDFMLNLEIRQTSFYSTTIAMNGFDGNPLPSSILVKIVNCNNNTFSVEYVSNSTANTGKYWAYGTSGSRTVTQIYPHGVLVDSGWIDITPMNNVELYDGASVFQYRKVGNILYLRGTLKNISGSMIVGNIPIGFRPLTVSHQFMMGTSALNDLARIARWQIGTNGDIMISNTSDGVFDVTHWFPVFTNYVI